MRAAFSFALAVLAASPAGACGVKTDCQLGERSYRLHMPERKNSDPVGAIIFAHGYKGSAAGTMSDKSLLMLADELGVALVAARSTDQDWQLPGRPRQTGNTGEIEFAYFRRLIEELKTRHGIDPGKLLLTGFSAGGMLIWNLACNMGGSFAGLAPVAGTFWAPMPESCKTPPANLIHYHGTADKMVPLAGRAIADTKQGDVSDALALAIKGGGFGAPEPVEAVGLECQRRTNPDGKILEFCTHGGGHSYKADYIRRAWRVLGIASR
ncbi:MAG: alpha/beta hydrolase family esterase [Rhodomicrobiaceae bacterium]